MRAFVDTNVLVYLVDGDNPGKRDQAAALLERHQADLELVISTQELQEFYVVITRKLATPLPLETAERAVRDLTALPMVVVDPDLVMEAITLNRSAGLAFRDALIVCAAQRAGAESLLTEDMQAGRRFGKTTLENPFAE